MPLKYANSHISIYEFQKNKIPSYYEKYWCEYVYLLLNNRVLYYESKNKTVTGIELQFSGHLLSASWILFGLNKLSTNA